MNKIWNVLEIIGGLFLLWVFISWIDVISHNLTTYIYQPWNAFVLFTKLFPYL